MEIDTNADFSSIDVAAADPISTKVVPIDSASQKNLFNDTSHVFF